MKHHVYFYHSKIKKERERERESCQYLNFNDKNLAKGPFFMEIFITLSFFFP